MLWNMQRKQETERAGIRVCLSSSTCTGSARYLFFLWKILSKKKKTTLNIFLNFFFYLKVQSFRLITANNFIQVAASADHAVAYTIGPIFKHISDCVLHQWLHEYCTLKRQLSLACRRNTYFWRHLTNNSPTLSNRCPEVAKRHQLCGW